MTVLNITLIIVIVSVQKEIPEGLTTVVSNLVEDAGWGDIKNIKHRSHGALVSFKGKPSFSSEEEVSHNESQVSDYTKNSGGDSGNYDKPYFSSHLGPPKT